MVWGLYQTFNSYIRLSLNSTVTDNIVFRYHYRITVWILIIGTILVTSGQFFGERINCLSDVEQTHVVNNYCFVKGTFTLILDNSRDKSSPSVYPGVGNVGTMKFHLYYQWVPFMLFFQAVMFYAPRYYYRFLEEGKIRNLAKAMNQVCVNRRWRYPNPKKIHPRSRKPPVKKKKSKEEQEKARKQKEHVIEHLFSIKRIKAYDSWAFNLFTCEMMCVVNLVFQIWLTDFFLNGQFIQLGLHTIIRKDIDHLNFVFPKMTKCLFYKIGSSGTIQIHDALCLMALNIIIEKVYLIMWAWLIVILPVITLCGVVWRVLTFILHKKRWFNMYIWSYCAAGGGSVKFNEDTYLVVQHFNYSQWLFFYYLTKNLKYHTIRTLLKDLENEMRLISKSDPTMDLTIQIGDPAFTSPVLDNESPPSCHESDNESSPPSSPESDNDESPPTPRSSACASAPPIYTQPPTTEASGSNLSSSGNTPHGEEPCDPLSN